MSVLSEEKLCSYLDQVLDLSRAVLAQIPANGAAPIGGDLRGRFEQLVATMHRDRESDDYLQDESWDWIWKGKDDLNTIQVYGRLAWINLQLLELL